MKKNYKGESKTNLLLGVGFIGLQKQGKRYGDILID